jgi:hypothetical protein
VIARWCTVVPSQRLITQQGTDPCHLAAIPAADMALLAALVTEWHLLVCRYTIDMAVMAVAQLMTCLDSSLLTAHHRWMAIKHS